MTGLLTLSALQWQLFSFQKTPQMSSPNKRNRYFIPNFEARSVLLVAAVTFGGFTGQQGQTTSPSPSTSASAAAEIIPENEGSTSEVDTAFDRVDTNKDGKLSRSKAENLPSVAKRFEQIDTNRDTFISREELAKFSGF